MQITCNGVTKDIASGTTVEQFILNVGVDPDTVVVEYNGRILKRHEYTLLLLTAGTTLELIRFVGGG